MKPTALTTQLENVYGLLAILGVITLAILGMLYKIVPFLVWYASYSKAVGRFKVPALADLYSVPLQIAGYWLFMAGLTGACMATAFGHGPGVGLSCAVLAGGVAVTAINYGLILMHLLRPRTQPIACVAQP